MRENKRHRVLDEVALRAAVAADPTLTTRQLAVKMGYSPGVIVKALARLNLTLRADLRPGRVLRDQLSAQISLWYHACGLTSREACERLDISEGRLKEILSGGSFISIERMLSAWVRSGGHYRLTLGRLSSASPSHSSAAEGQAP